MTRGLAFSILIVFLMLWSVPGFAGDTQWRVDGSGPTFAEIIADAPNVVFAQITAVDGTGVRASISKAIKGSVRDEIRIISFNKLKYQPIKDSRSFFKAGEDYFFFLNAAMIGSVPFEPVRNSVALKVDRGTIRTSVLSPAFPQYFHEFDYEIFDGYLSNLAQRLNQRPVDPVFLGRLLEKLEAASQNANDTMAASYLKMVAQLSPSYDNTDILFNLLKSKDINARLLAIQTLTDLSLQLRKATPAKDKSAKTKKRKRSKSRKGKTEKKSKVDLIFDQISSTLQSDSSQLVRSVAAKALSIIQDQRAIPVLADMIDKTEDKQLEQCELYPARGLETSMSAVLRAVIEFESEDSLDVLERELLKNKVDSFRVILEIFRDYADMDLNLLLLDLLQDRNFLPRQVAILEYFRSIKDDVTIQGLKDLFVSPEAGSEFIRKSIIEVFEDYKEPKSTVEFLMKNGLHDPSPVVRQAAARALGKLGDPKAVSEFREIYFKESNRLAREFFVEALAQIKSPSAYECLKWLLEKETDPRMVKQIKFAMKKSRFLSR